MVQRRKIFYSLFQFGNSDKVIHSIDSDGVLLASVQGLHQVLHDLKRKLDDHQSLANIQSEQSRELNKTLTDVSKRLSVTERAIQHHFRLLDQFESDHNDQNAMIAYIHQALFLGTWSYYLSGLQRPLGWLFVAGVGLALGGLYSVWVIRRRGAYDASVVGVDCCYGGLIAGIHHCISFGIGIV